MHNWFAAQQLGVAATMRRLSALFLIVTGQYPVLTQIGMKGVWQRAISETRFCRRRLRVCLVEPRARSRRRNLSQERLFGATGSYLVQERVVGERTWFFGQQAR